MNEQTNVKVEKILKKLQKKQTNKQLCLDLKKEHSIKLNELAKAQNFPITSMATLLLETAITWRYNNENELKSKQKKPKTNLILLPPIPKERQIVDREFNIRGLMTIKINSEFFCDPKCPEFKPNYENCLPCITETYSEDFNILKLNLSITPILHEGE